MYILDLNELLAKLDYCRHSVSTAKMDPNWLFDDEKKIQLLVSVMSRCREIASDMGLRLTKNSAGKYIQTLGITGYDGHARVSVLEKDMAELDKRLIEELEGAQFYYLGSSAHLLSAPDQIFGKKIEATFPKAMEDLDEAAKCLAFSRPTASVFHLMRAMEIAVQNLFSKIGLTGNPEKEWGKLLSDISKAIEAMPKGSARDEWSASHSHLYHVKQAFRNDVMHPKQTYTEVEAKEVFDAVKSFMRHLAELPAIP
jgi:hypothetical protein